MKHAEINMLEPDDNTKTNIKLEDIFEEEEDFTLLMPYGNAFGSDDDSLNDLQIDLGCGNEFEDELPSEPTKRNKRKTLVPQRAIQHGESSSENSQHSNTSPCKKNSHEIDETNDESDIEEFKEFDEECIFKNIKEETDGEILDKDILENVKEEYRAHWGIKCNMCEKIFTSKPEFDAHYKDSYKTDAIYTCKLCNRAHEKYSAFRSHCYRHINEGRFKCKECDKGFILQSVLQVHMLKHTRSKPYKCEQCGKAFVTKPGLKIHLNKHKSEVHEDYPCVECGKILQTRGGLTAHMNVHRLGRRFMCDVCGKTFTQKVNMQQHVKQHTGDKPHECDKCGKTFAEKSHLARHYSFHSEHRPFKCEVCQKMYKTERCLKVHSMVHSKERPFICTYCSKGFLSSTKLKQHYNIHTGEKPFACKYCERKFTNYPNWLKHTRRRHNVDHRTGELLPPKPTKSKATKQPVEKSTFTLKEEPIPAANLDSEEPIVDLLPNLDVDDHINEDNLITDFSLSKSDELLLQQGLLNFPISDDKFLLQQQIDLLPSSASNNLIVPYLQTQLPSHHTLLQSNTQNANDFISLQFIQ